MVPVQYNVRSLLVRKVTTFATAFGIALVIFVFAAGQMLGEGVRRALVSSGRDDTAIVIRDGSDSELASRVGTDAVSLLRAKPQVARPASGSDTVVGEVVSVITAELADGSGGISNVLIRGTQTHGVAFRPEIKIIRGRAPKPGTDEAMVGRAIAGRFKGIGLGQSFELRRAKPLQVVGVFEAAGSSYESEVWGDAERISDYLKRSNVYSSARVRLADTSQFPAFKQAIEADKQLGLEVMRESEYYRKVSGQTAGFLTGMGTAIAILFALAAMIGATITMNGAVAHRTREIGTLRALGFSRLAILTSFLFEAILLALFGGVFGIACVMLLSLVSFPTMNFQTFSQIIIGFRATPGIVVSALIFSVVMGLIGGLFPAIRAARVSPVDAMRA